MGDLATVQLDGRVALVAGAASGSGEAPATALAEACARVALADITEGAGEKAAAALIERDMEALFFTLDVTDEDQWVAAIRAVEEALGPLDILFNNAGIRPVTAAIEDTTLDEWRRVNAVNLDGVFLGTKHAIRAMTTRGGAIINTASVYGLRGAPMIGAYGAAKHGVLGLTKSAALECQHLGYPIRINAVCPGYIATNLTESIALEFGDDDSEERFAKATPMNRIGQPREIADTVVYLASEAASFVTGTHIVVDGGFAAG